MYPRFGRALKTPPSPRVVIESYKKHEDEYLSIAKKYSKDELGEFSQTLADLMTLMSHTPDDYLGRFTIFIIGH